jgi:hypothetical protein
VGEWCSNSEERGANGQFETVDGGGSVYISVEGMKLALD